MRFVLFVVAAALLGCSSEAGEHAVPGPSSPRPWDRLAVPTSVLPDVRTLRPVRGIIHSHSPYSHDACDGQGLLPDGSPDPVCTADLRRGMCEASEDFVFLTDHASNMAEADFADLLFFGDGDTPITSNSGTPIGNLLDCGNGRRTLITAGNENKLMSLGLEQHLPGDAATRLAEYDADGAATVQAMHDAGALVMIPHTESRDLDYLRALPFDGMEIYNLHAAIDPDIRRDFLGLDAYGAVAGILPFTNGSEAGPEPDLAILGFFEDLPRYAEIWDALLPERRVPGVAGTDVHENTFPGQLRDGERGDSYRRLMRWFSNVVLLDGELTTLSLKAALAAGRSYVAFEILGVPIHFDFYAESAGTTIEMGSEAPAGAALYARAPDLYDPDPAAEQPEISMRLLRITANGSEVAREGSEIDVAAATPGAYRIEVRITPHHLRAYLGPAPDDFIKSYLWVMSNPIYVV